MKILTETGLTELIRKIKTTKQDNLPTVTSSEYNNVLHTNSNTGALEWVDTATASILTVESVPTASSTNLVTSGGVYTALAGKVSTTDIVTAVSSSSTDTQVPSAKCLYDTIGDIETLLQGLR